MQVEHLSKSYVIRHRAGTARYRTLREAIVEGAGRLARWSWPPGRAGGDPDRPSTELYWALKDVSFDVEAGELLAIMGGNGAGKSTLLKILSRVTEPTEGKARLLGRVASLQDPVVIDKILAHLDAKAAPAQAARPPPCRAPPEGRSSGEPAGAARVA